MKLTLCLYSIFLWVNVAGTSKILIVFPFATASHNSLGETLVNALLDRGHNITYLTPFPKNKNSTNLRYVSNAETISTVSKFQADLFNMGRKSAIGQMMWTSNLGLQFTEATLKNKNVQSLLMSNETFDLVLVEHFVNEAHMVFAHIFKCPLVILTPGPTSIMNNHFFANPSPISYIPNIVSGMEANMNFWQRLKNSFHFISQNLYREFIALPKQNALLKNVVPNAPDIYDIIYNISLMLTMSDISLFDPAPSVPAIKHIGGFHIKPSKPLPEDLKKYLDEAEEGVIVFSMGSNLKSSAFTKEKKAAVLNSFAKIKQKVIWKFEKDLPEKSDNVKIMNWLPQQDILAHPNVKLFISHGGLLSTTETVYHGIPMIGIPVFWDQENNIETAVLNGYAIKIKYSELTEEAFTNALKEILNNTKYRENVKQRSKLIRDQPMKPIDSAVYWIEYVIRHKGAFHLQTVGMKLTWYKQYLIDVIGFVLLIVIILFSIVGIVIKRFKIFAKCKTKNVSKTKKNK